MSSVLAVVLFVHVVLSMADALAGGKTFHGGPVIMRTSVDGNTVHRVEFLLLMFVLGLHLMSFALSDDAIVVTRHLPGLFGPDVLTPLGSRHDGGGRDDVKHVVVSYASTVHVHLGLELVVMYGMSVEPVLRVKLESTGGIPVKTKVGVGRALVGPEVPRARIGGGL